MGQGYEYDSIRKLIADFRRHLECETGLADTGRSCQGEYRAAVAQQDLRNVGDLAPAPDERGARKGKVRPAGHFGRRDCHDALLPLKAWDTSQ